MDSKYKPLPPVAEDPHRSSYESSTTLDGLDDHEKTPRYGLLDSTPPVTLVRMLSSSNWIWLLHTILFISSLTLFALAVTMRASTLKHVREFSAWSPADISVQYHSLQYNLNKTDNPFVGYGPDVDKAWREISYDAGDQWIPNVDIAKLGMPETGLKMRHPKTGEEGYRVGMEVFHQLHCLNLLRRVTYRDYYEPLGGEFAKGPKDVQAHTDHCIEVLRLNTQCYADIGLFTFYMVEGDPLAWPELNSKHMCRNFDRVRQWALDHSVGNMEVIL